jgi:hypothetical protein
VALEQACAAAADGCGHRAANASWHGSVEAARTRPNGSAPVRCCRRRSPSAAVPRRCPCERPPHPTPPSSTERMYHAVRVVTSAAADRLRKLQLLTAAGEMKCAFGSGVELTETDLPLNDGLCPLGEGRRYGGRDAPLARTEGLRRTGTLVRPAKPGGVCSRAGASSVSASRALVDFVFLQMSISSADSALV